MRHAYLLIILLIALCCPRPSTAQDDPTRPIISPENAGTLAEQASVELGVTTAFTPAWSPDNSWVAIPAGATGALVVDVQNSTLVDLAFPPLGAANGGEVTSVAFSPDGNFLVTGETSPVGTVQVGIWNPYEASFIAGGPRLAADKLTFISDEVVFARGGAVAELNDLSTGVTTEILPDVALILPVISPDGTIIASYDPAGPQLLDATTGDILGQALTAVPPYDTAFSPDSALLAVAMDVRVATTTEIVPAQIFDATNGALLRTMQGEFMTIFQPAFSPDSQLLAAAVCANYDTDGVACTSPEIWLWDVATGQRVGGLSFAAGQEVRGLAFSPDGTWLAVVVDGTARFYGVLGTGVPATATPIPTTANTPLPPAPENTALPTPGTYTLVSTATGCDGYGVANGPQAETSHRVTVNSLTPTTIEVKISGTMAGAPLFLLGGVAGRDANTFQAYLFLDGATTARFSEVTLELVSPIEMRGTFEGSDCLLEFGFILVEGDLNAGGDDGINLGVTGCQVTSPDGSPVNRRVGPSTDFEIVAELGGQDIGRVIGQTTDAEGQIWWQLTDNSWVRSDVVTENDACVSVPFVTP